MVLMGTLTSFLYIVRRLRILLKSITNIYNKHMNTKLHNTIICTIEYDCIAAKSIKEI